MPYRIDVPEGENALFYLLNNVGTPSLIAARQDEIRTVYTNQETPLTHREREGMRILGTAIVGCPICNSLRLWRDYPGFCDEEIPEEFYQNCLDKNYTWPGFSQREILAVQFADRFQNDIDNLNGDDIFWEKIKANFSEREIADLCYFNSYFVGTGRALKAMGIGSVCDVIPPHDSDEIQRIVKQA